MAYLCAVVLGLTFGGADQYLGSLVELGPWTYTVSAMSAPWLALPFAAGATQRRPQRAALLGAAIVVAAFAGYFAMTLSPLEGVPIHRAPMGLVYLAQGQLPYIAGGAFTAPAYGWLGHQWRFRRSALSGAIVAAALCFEPLVRAADRRLSPPTTAWLLEAALGLGAGAYFVMGGLLRHARPPAAP